MKTCISMIRRKILVPINFSPQSHDVLKFASKITRAINGMMTCLHILEEPGFITGKFISPEIHNRIRREAEMRLSSLVIENIDAAEKTPFEIIISSGKVHTIIDEKATDLHAAFIIMGRSDSADLKKNFIGTNTNRVISLTKIPVITVRSNKYFRDEQILLPLDLSKPIGSKIVKTIEVAHMLNAHVSVLTILEPDCISQEVTYRSRLEKIRQLFSNEGITCNVHLTGIKKSVTEEIIAYSKKMHAGMIVVMTQQETNITDFFIGSTARSIIQKSEFPILSIIPGVQLNEYPNDSVIGNVLNPISLLKII